MPEEILTHEYWRERLRQAQQQHHAIYRCPLPLWQRIEARHRDVLARTIGPADSVLDAGCGWGRLLDLLPDDWGGLYLGIDLSPDMIDLAHATHPGRAFLAADLRDLSAIRPYCYDWAILVSIRPMMRRHLGEKAWVGMEQQIRQVSRRLLYLEYDPDDGGSVE
jgi:SAM-dependent methyltransferase